MSNLNVDIRLLTAEDEEIVVEFINTQFTPYFKAAFGNESDPIEEFNKFQAFRVKMYMKQMYSVGAFDKVTNKLIAVQLNAIRQKWLDPPIAVFEENGITLSQSLRNWCRLSAEIERNIFEKLQTDKVFFFGVIATHKEYRQMRLFHELGVKSLEFATQSSCQHILFKLTSSFMIKSFKEKVNNALYFLKMVQLDEFIDLETGLKPYINIPSTYSHLALMVQNIDKTKSKNSVSL